MVVDRIILISIWVLTLGLVVITTPRQKIREAMVVFLFKQMLTWLLGFVVVEHKLIEYPVREFPYAARNSFSFEYFIYPAICIVFNLRSPADKKWFHKLLWYLFFPSWMTGMEVLLEKHTHLIQYIHWNWYWSWIALLATFYISRTYYLWFLKRRTGALRI